ncbi:hypothetical protein ACWZJV_14560 [Nocardioides sp. WG-D5]
MLKELLYGPARVESGGGAVVQVRSMVLEPDLIAELAQLVAERTGHSELRAGPIGDPSEGPSEIVAAENIRTLPTWQLTRLVLHGGTTGEGGPIFVDFRYGTQPVIIANEPGDRRLMTEIADRLDAEGKPRINWHRLLGVMPWLICVVIVAAWVGVIAAERPGPSWIVFGSLVAVVMSASSWHMTAALERRLRPGWPGHLIRPMSRAEVRAHRASRRAGLKQAAITVPAAAFLGALAQWIFTR